MDAVALLQVGSAALLNLGFTWLVGTWFARRWLPAGRPISDWLVSLRRYDNAAIVVTIAASAAALWAATAIMAGVPLGEAGNMFWTMLTTTAHGNAGCVAIAVMVLLLGVRCLGKDGRATESLVLLLLVIFAATRASMGHAGEEGWWTAPHVAETVHLVAIAIWSGAVIVSAWPVLQPARVQELPRVATDHYLDRMSQAAMLAVIAIAATGIYSGWHRVGSAEHLVHTQYGYTLLTKVGLVLGAIALGGYNKFWGLPGAARSATGVAVVRRVLQIEAVLLLGALAAAAYLTVQQPPAVM
ncbi:copper resistance D family protein [Pseudoduganella umbonata]|uniref:Copper resistance protein CopD n=1 Tax=Pseudoduganella umbonata TaxID=864828 RepID=A0A4P8HR51_9BURK|nr:CopD family protein [Pseudoduganella umbonata]MBB3222068.1 putative copper resistance protein D [Pseudoduganella umbonata]QCP12309.1 copper resistance protein CopD [Pseudoduganella umbonata]